MRKKMRRLISAAFALALVLAFPAVPAQAASFPDVQYWAWYAKYVDYLTDAGVINGYEDGTFKPDNEITRGEFLKMICESAWMVPYSGSPNWGWASKYWQMAQDNELLLIDAETQETLFGSSVEELAQPITRYEMAVIISNTTAAKLTNMEARRVKTTSPSDYIVGYWDIEEKYRDAVEQVYGKGIVAGVKDVEGVEDGSFCGENTLTRAEASKIVYMIWTGERNLAPYAEWVERAAVEEATDYVSFAMSYRNMSESERRLALFGNSSKTYFTSSEDAAGYMTTVTVPCWKLDTGGNKYASTISLTVHYLVAKEVELIFNDIYNDPEQFPLVTWGGARFTDKLRHSWGCAIDLNYDQNYYCRVIDGIPTALTGSGWWPGENAYSIQAGGSVVRAFAKYGWGWGGQGWSGGYYDYMHFSILASGG